MFVYMLGPETPYQHPITNQYTSFAVNVRSNKSIFLVQVPLVAELFKQLNRYFYKKEGIFLLLFAFFMTLLAHSIYKNGFLSF